LIAIKLSRPGVADSPDMPVLAFANLKGGVAKTTNAVAVAETFASRGHSVLMLDADHQCTASEVLLGEARMLKAEREKRTLHDLLSAMLDREFDQASFGKYVVGGGSNVVEVRQRISVLPCSVRIDEFQSNVAKARRRRLLTGSEFSDSWRRHRTAMSRWLQNSFDFTIIDCPPSLTRHVQLMLRLCDGIVIPAVPDHLSLRGAIQFDKRLQEKGISTRVLGTLWTLYRAQVEKHKVVVSLARKRISRPGQVPLPFETIIPNAAALAAAADADVAFGTLKQKYSPQFAPLYDFLCDEILRRLQSRGTDPDPTQPGLALVPVRRR